MSIVLKNKPVWLKIGNKEGPASQRCKGLKRKKVELGSLRVNLVANGNILAVFRKDRFGYFSLIESCENDKSGSIQYCIFLLLKDLLDSLKHGKTQVNAPNNSSGVKKTHLVAARQLYFLYNAASSKDYINNYKKSNDYLKLSVLAQKKAQFWMPWLYDTFQKELGKVPDLAFKYLKKYLLTNENALDPAVCKLPEEIAQDWINIKAELEKFGGLSERVELILFAICVVCFGLFCYTLVCLFTVEKFIVRAFFRLFALALCKDIKSTGLCAC